MKVPSWHSFISANEQRVLMVRPFKRFGMMHEGFRTHVTENLLKLKFEI